MKFRNVRPISIDQLQPGMIFTLFEDGTHLLRCNRKVKLPGFGWTVTGTFLNSDLKDDSEPVSESYDSPSEVYIY